mgnify:CR=1 FL=1
MQLYRRATAITQINLYFCDDSKTANQDILIGGYLNLLCKLLLIFIHIITFRLQCKQAIIFISFNLYHFLSFSYSVINLYDHRLFYPFRIFIATRQHFHIAPFTPAIYFSIRFLSQISFSGLPGTIRYVTLRPLPQSCLRSVI